MQSFLAAADARAADAQALPSRRPALLERLDADLLLPIVAHADTRWRHDDGIRAPLPPLAVCALACVSHAVLEKLRLVRPAIRTGTFGQSGSGALDRFRNPARIRSVGGALDFERRSAFRIGQLSSLSYSDVEGVAGLASCRMLHTLQLTQCKRLRSVDGLAACPSLCQLYLVNCGALADVEGLRGSLRLHTLEVSGCRRLSDVTALASCAQLENLSLTGCTAVTDVRCLGECSALRTLDLLGCRGVDDVGALRRCERLWKLDIRGTGYTGATHLSVPTLPAVTELRGPGWQDLGTRGKVLLTV